jgi:hypothetical protein
VRNLGKEKAEVVDCQRIIGNNYRYLTPMVMSQNVFPSVVAVVKPVVLTASWFCGVSSVHIAFNMFVVYHCAAQPITPYRVTSLSEVTV